MTKRSSIRRRNEGFVQPLERPVLQWLSARMPAWVTPDMLTAIGILGALVTFLGYFMSGTTPGMLWLASLGLVLNWFGDSLDGTLARYRHIERPRYGFFIDHTTDLFEQIVICLGLGLSSYVHFELAMIGLIVYLLLSLLTFVRAQVLSTLQISYAGFGPTEIRLILIAMNTLIWLVPPWPMTILGFHTGYPDLLSITWSVLGLLVLAIQVRLTFAQLKRQSEEGGEVPERGASR